MTDQPEVLRGGIANAGAVVRVGDNVLRPTSPQSPTIHALLTFLRRRRFREAPEFVGMEPDGRERLGFVAGDVPTVPFPAWSQTDAALASTAALLRRFHDATVGFETPAGGTWSRELADPNPGSDPVICHNDVCPENVVYRQGSAVALLDFDFAAPGRRVWDVAALASMCIPIDTDDDAASTGRRGLDPVARLRVVADAYGLEPDDREALLDALTVRFADRGGFVRRRVEAGEAAFVEMWNAMGGQARYDRRADWFATERARFLDALLA